MKVVVGLGNPGRKYEGTRHNIGFAILDEVAARHTVGRPRSLFQSLVAEANVGDAKTLLVWPQTFMNRSGGAVLAARDYYKLAAEDLLVVCDDFNLPLAKLRFRSEGSSGGQRGLADVLQRLGTDRISRLRIGVGTPAPHYDPADWVLSKFRKDEADEVAHLIVRASDAVAAWISEGTVRCMNQFN